MYVGEVPPFRYTYAKGILDQLDENQVSWQAVEFVLQISHPKIRRWVLEDILQIIGRDQLGQLLLVTLQDLGDGPLEVVTARYLSEPESNRISDASRE